MPQASPIRTDQVLGRRGLHFSTIDEALAEGERVAMADRAGRVRCLGNWTLGQNLGHLATWVQMSFDGVPMKVPWFVRLFMRPMRSRFLYKPMAPGRNVPGVSNGTFGTEPLTLDEGLARFRQTYTRLKTETPSKPNVLFGPLTHDQWINLHLRHAELHLSFVVTQAALESRAVERRAGD
jgi:hypothetical protein